jgi:hypothetical protein
MSELVMNNDNKKMFVEKAEKVEKRKVVAKTISDMTFSAS